MYASQADLRQDARGHHTSRDLAFVGLVKQASVWLLMFVVQPSICTNGPAINAERRWYHGTSHTNMRTQESTLKNKRAVRGCRHGWNGNVPSWSNELIENAKSNPPSGNTSSAGVAVCIFGWSYVSLLYSIVVTVSAPAATATASYLVVSKPALCAGKARQHRARSCCA